MSDEGPLSSRKLSAVGLHELFRDAQELFERRLHQKAQSLVCSISEPLGLTLTREHLKRMGGNLTLRRAPSGDSEAVIELGLA